MRHVLFLFFLFFPAVASAAPFSYATGGCADGCAQGEQWLYTNGNELNTYLDGIDTRLTSAESSISTLTNTFAGYLPLAGGNVTGTITLQSGAGIGVPTGAAIAPSGSGIILASGMSATGQIDDNDLAAGAVDGGTGGEIADDSITAADIAAGAVTTSEILDDTVALTTDTSGNYVATVTGDTEITVSGAGTEGRAVTLAIASTLTRDTELDGKSVGSSTDNAIVRFDGTTGDVQDSLATVADTTGTITTPGNLSAGGSSGASTIVMRNMADSGWVECGVNTTTWTCATDADGVADGTL